MPDYKWVRYETAEWFGRMLAKQDWTFVLRNGDLRMTTNKPEII